MAPKFGDRFDCVSKLFDHAAHNGSNYLNGHCFVSIMLCVPVMNGGKIHYLSVPLGYRMWTKETSKISLAAELVRKAMPELKAADRVILLFDSWYTKSELICVHKEFNNLDIICNARCDTAIFDLPPARTGKKGRPSKRGARLDIYDDFELSSDRVAGYFIGCRKVLTNIFEDVMVYAYATASGRDSATRRLFFSTLMPWDVRMSCAWQEKSPLNQTGVEWMNYIPLFLYQFRWNIEVGYYESKTFWSLCSYMVRGRKGIEMMVNLTNITYCAMKLLPYADESFSDYRGCSTQEVRRALSEQINSQIFFMGFVKNIESRIKSERLARCLKMAMASMGYHF